MNGWHVPDDLRAAYLDGGLPEAAAMSVEVHVASCQGCQAAFPVQEEWLEESWAAIADVVDRPAPRPLTRGLTALGMPEHVAVFLAATPGLTRSWLLGVAGALGFAVAAAHAADRSMLVFLAVAPVLPLLGIAAAYGARVDALYEVASAAPISGGRVLLLRAMAVLVAALLVTGAATPALPAFTAAWLLPSLALTGAALALGPLLAPHRASALLAAGWLAAVPAGREAVFGAPAQAAYAMALIPFVYLGARRWNRL
ncbi:zf-HC2 domain-containing protein [Herbidospora daliensis]|uniref:zf-HC2 domain-containing protein n=1 Tax=Herbidospora daliensis TaxID=295585 RepID=UPI0007840996|nr:zf-HC2 domain-containing protein [Herbidospora daliensis]